MLLRGAAPCGARQRGLSSGSVLRRWRCHAARDASRPPSSASERRLPRREADGVSSGGLPGKKLSRKPLADPTGLALWSSLMDVDADDSEDLAELESVLKVFCTHSEPSWSSPWQRRRQYASTSSGFFIAGKRLLTNAHSVEHSTCVSVMRRGDERKWLARVLAVSTECDLALLTVDDAAFWESQPLALSFGKLPRLQEPVAVLGYPVGGETLSVTAGVVSRIEVTEYVHGATQLLTVQIDAAINPGNSGGPVVNERGECVGVAFQSLGGDSENVGYVVPTPVVAHFLADFERNGGKAVTGFPTVGFEWQPAEAAALRASLLLPASTRPRGVLVTRVEATSPMAAVVRRGDVLVSFNGADVSCDGTTAFRAGERISFSHLVAQCFVGESAGLGLVREGNPVSVNVTLGAHTVLVPPFFDAAAPSYLVVGGCVFVAACEPYLRAEFGEVRVRAAPYLTSLPTWPDPPPLSLEGLRVRSPRAFAARAHDGHRNHTRRAMRCAQPSACGGGERRLRRRAAEPQPTGCFPGPACEVPECPSTSRERLQTRRRPVLPL